MGQALSAVDCLRQAIEALDLAYETSDDNLRDGYVTLARHLMELATTLEAQGDPAPSRSRTMPADEELPAPPPRLPRKG